MQRLTKRVQGYAPYGWEGGVFLGDKAPTEQCPKVFCKRGKGCTHIKERTCPLLRALDRLAAYEDTELEPSEIADLQMKISLCIDKADTIEPEKMPFILYAFKQSLDDLATAQAELAELRQADRWIPVSERLPGEPPAVETDDDYNWDAMSEYSVMIDGASMPTCLYYAGNGQWIEWAFTGQTQQYSVTHWRPLPEPPKGVDSK